MQNILFGVSIILFSIMMAGCTSQTKIKSNEVYQGYPCEDRCIPFKEGYDLAQSSSFKTTSDCDNISQDKKIGCLSYVHEYKSEHEAAQVIFDSKGRSYH